MYIDTDYTQFDEYRSQRIKILLEQIDKAYKNQRYSDTNNRKNRR